MRAKRQFPFGKPMLDDAEREAVMKVLMGTQLVHGPVAHQFEADFVRYIGGGFATSVSNCTAGLHLAYFYLGTGPGDEVIVPAQTHVATAHAVEFTGATPVFVDCDPKTGNIAIDEIEAAITPRTRAICVVHYLGLPVDMDRINAIAARHGLSVVEDCALAIGSRFKGVHAGLLGDIGQLLVLPGQAFHHRRRRDGRRPGRKRSSGGSSGKRPSASTGRWPNARFRASTTSPCLATTTA